MEKSRRNLLKTIGVASGVRLAGCISDGDTSKPDRPESKLFLQESDDAEIRKMSAGGYKIILEDVDSRVTWFGDRPERNAGEVSMKKFIDGWSRYGFRDTPPNAAVTGVHDGERKIMTVELRTAEYDKKNDRVTYTAKKLSRNPGGNLKRLHKQKERVKGSVELSDPNLYIDPANGVTILRKFQEVNKKGDAKFGNQESESGTQKSTDLSSYVELGEGLKNARMKVTKEKGGEKQGTVLVDDKSGDTHEVPESPKGQIWTAPQAKDGEGFSMLPEFLFILGNGGLEARFKSQLKQKTREINLEKKPKAPDREGGERRYKDIVWGRDRAKEGKYKLQKNLGYLLQSATRKQVNDKTPDEIQGMYC